MTQLERPKNLPDLAAGFVLNNLSDEEIMLWDSLCDQDPKLMEKARQLQQTFNHFADVIPQYLPSPQLMANLRLAVQNEVGHCGNSDLSSVSSTAMPGGDRPYPWQRLGGILGVSLLACLGLQVYKLHRQVQQVNTQLLQTQRQLQSAETQLTDVNYQLNQSAYRLTVVEQELATSKSREEAMSIMLQQFRKDAVGQHN